MATVTRTVTAFLGFAGHRKDGERVEATMPQFDGSFMAGFNCAASSESVRAIESLAGRRVPAHNWPPTPRLIRAESGDRSGGLRPTQTAAVSHRLWSIDSDIRIADTNILITKLAARFAATLLVRYEPFGEDGRSGSPGFNGNHSFNALGIRWLSDGDRQILISDSLRDGRRAGIPRGVIWVPEQVVQHCLSGLDLGGGTSMIEAHGSHHGYFSFPTDPYNAPPPPAKLVLRFGAHKVKAKLLRANFRNTIIRSSPRKIQSNHARVVPINTPFNAYQRVDNKDGAWVGNKAGTLWVLRPGFRFIKYI